MVGKPLPSVIDYTEINNGAYVLIAATGDFPGPFPMLPQMYLETVVNDSDLDAINAFQNNNPDADLWIYAYAEWVEVVNFIALASDLLNQGVDITFASYEVVNGVEHSRLPVIIDSAGTRYIVEPSAKPADERILDTVRDYGMVLRLVN